MNKEYDYDKLLNIKTEGKQRTSPSSIHYYPYEPTPYSALETLFENYEVKKSDHIVDFGCGKGRLNFYIHYFFKASVVGIEKEETLYQAAVGNYQSYIKKHRTKEGAVQFICCLAEEYLVHPSDNRFYFFNPFSIQIFMRTTRNIMLSFEEAPREMELLLYYPSMEYIDFLENQTPFQLKQEIVLKDWYQKDPYEKFLIYSLSY